MLPSVVSGSQSHHATVNAITRHVVTGRLASWLVALDDYLSENTRAEYRLALVLVFPVILRYRSTTMSGWSSSRRCLVHCHESDKSSSTTRIFGGSGSYLPFPPYFQHVYLFNVLDVIQVELIMALTRHLGVFGVLYGIWRGKHRGDKFVSLVNVASTGIDTFDLLSIPVFRRHLYKANL